jgi:hypothetical protein
VEWPEVGSDRLQARYILGREYVNRMTANLEYKRIVNAIVVMLNERRIDRVYRMEETDVT